MYLPKLISWVDTFNIKNMNIIDQTIYKISLNTGDYFMVEAETMEEALKIAQEVINVNYKCKILTGIYKHLPVYRAITKKTVTINL